MATTAEALLKGVSEIMAKMAEFLVKMQTEMPGRGGGGGRRSLDVRNIADKRFNGKMEDWTDWAFVFRRSIKANCLGAYEMMVRPNSRSGGRPRRPRDLGGEVFR
jgi:hypothetical protein